MGVTELFLEIENIGNQSRIAKQYFTGPIKPGTPRREDGRLNVMLMMASAGVLKGDVFEYRIHCGQRTRVLLTEQSYTKLFNMGEGRAQKTQHITLDRGASLFYCPQAVIPFAGSSFDSHTDFDLAKDSELLYTDILTAGRVGMGERFLFSRYRSRICVRIDKTPAWIDNCLLEPSPMDMENMVFFDNFTHMGTLYYYGGLCRETEEKILELADRGQEGISIAASRAWNGVCIRALAHSAQEIEMAFDVIKGEALPPPMRLETPD